MAADETDACEDWNLAQQAAAGDENAFRALIEKYQTAVHRFIFRSVHDEETASDIAQEVFVKAWFALGRLKGEGQFTTWLFQIAVNLCRDYAKSKAARQIQVTHSLASPRDDGSSEERSFPHPSAPPDKAAESAEALAVVEAEIRALPSDIRGPFLLGVVEGYSHAEISRMLGCSIKAVETRIYRARKTLAVLLRQRGFG